MRRVEFQKRMSGYGELFLSSARAPLSLSAANLITPEIDDLDADEVLNPEGEPETVEQVADRRSTLASAFTPRPAPEPEAEQEPLSLLERCKAPKMSLSEAKALIEEAVSANDLEAVTALLVRNVASVKDAKPEQRSALRARCQAAWDPYASQLYAEKNEMISACLVDLGCPFPEATVADLSQDTTFPAESASTEESAQDPLLAEFALELAKLDKSNPAIGRELAKLRTAFQERATNPQRAAIAEMALKFGK